MKGFLTLQKFKTLNSRNKIVNKGKSNNEQAINKDVIFGRKVFLENNVTKKEEREEIKERYSQIAFKSNFNCNPTVLILLYMFSISNKILS